MKALQGFTIGASDGDIGTVTAFYFDDPSFTVRHLVVDTGGWLAGRLVLISPFALRQVDWDAGRIDAALTKAQVENSPDIDTARPVSRQQEIEYYRHYGYPSYWTGPYLWGPLPYPGPVLAPSGPTSYERERRWDWGGTESGDPHLRSSEDVIGYYLEARDGDLGHVEDFLVDDQSWSVRYMVVDTRNWLPGKKVLVSPEWIAGIDWNDSKVRVDLTREEVKNSPEYDPTGPIEREYEGRLHDYYGRPRYWSDRRDAA